MATDAVNPNALGAPAEGFGQTVSFAFDPRGEVPQVNPVTSRGPNVGGANNVSGMVRNDTRRDDTQYDDPTANLLMKAGKDILDKQLDQARSAEFIKGMQRSMAGEGIKEVKDSVPWYAKIFGDTPAIEGARAYQAQDTVNKVVSQQAAKMHELEKLGPEEAGKHFAQVMQGALTGDAQTDGIIMKQMTEAMPTLMKAQAKANYGYNQKRAASAMSASINSGAAALQQYGEAHANDTVDDKGMEVLRRQFVTSVLPPAGIDEENYQKTLSTNIMTMAENGQFHAVEALRKSGVISALTPEQGVRVDKAVEAAATRARDRYAFQYSRTIAEIKSDAAHPPAGTTPAQLSERIDRANSAFQKLTGSPVGLFSSDQKADMLAGTFNAYKAEEEKAATRAQVLSDRNAKADAKAAAAEQTQQTIRTMAANGDVNLAKKLPGVSDGDVDLEVYKLARQDPAHANEYLRNVWAKGYVSKLVADEVQAPLKLAAAGFGPGSPPPDSFFKSVNAYRSLVQTGGVAYANDYFGEYAKTMAYASYALADNVLANPQAGEIFQRAMKAKDWKGDPLSHKETQELVKKVTSEGKDWINAATFGMAGHALNDDAIRHISEDISESVAQWRSTGLSDKEAVAVAMNEAMGPSRKGGQRGEILGGYYIRRDPTASSESLSSIMEGGKGTSTYTAVPEELKSDIFKSFLKDKVKLPDNLGTTQIYRMPDVAGTPQFVITGLDKDGLTTIRRFTGSDLQGFAADKTKWKRLGKGSRPVTDEEYNAANADRKTREATPYVPIKMSFGPQITYDAHNDATRRIYQDAATRAAEDAKRQKQFATK